jgi:hypothetical protein
MSSSIFRLLSEGGSYHRSCLDHSSHLISCLNYGSHSLAPVEERGSRAKADAGQSSTTIETNCRNLSHFSLFFFEATETVVHEIDVYRNTKVKRKNWKRTKGRWSEQEVVMLL